MTHIPAHRIVIVISDGIVNFHYIFTVDVIHWHRWNDTIDFKTDEYMVIYTEEKQWYRTFNLCSILTKQQAVESMCVSDKDLLVTCFSPGFRLPSSPVKSLCYRTCMTNIQPGKQLFRFDRYNPNYATLQSRYRGMQ